MASFDVAPTPPATPIANLTHVGSRSVIIALLYQTPWLNGVVEVWRGGDVENLTRIGVVEGGGVQFRDDTVLPATLYAYRLRAVSGNGTVGELSDVIVATTPEADEISQGAVTASKVSDGLSRSLLNGGAGVSVNATASRRVVRPAITDVGLGYPATGPFDTVLGWGEVSVPGQWQAFARLAVRSEVATGLRVRASVRAGFAVPTTPWSGKVRHFFRVQLTRKSDGAVVCERVVKVLQYATSVMWISQPDAIFEDETFTAPNGSNPAKGWYIDADTDYLLTWAAMVEREGTALNSDMVVQGYALDFDFIKPGDGLIL